MNSDVILVINSGSSSIKFSLFDSEKISLIYHGEIEKIFFKPMMSVYDINHTLINQNNNIAADYESALQAFFNWFESLENNTKLKAVGHRVVHGGKDYLKPTRITSEVVLNLNKLIPFAPLHEPHNLESIRIITIMYPKLPQIACFDTSFHRTQLPIATLFAVPRKFTDEGIIRYGFHGISYEYIASVLPKYLENMAESKIIVAHLGSGASMCAMRHRKSVATSMGMSALDGLMMGTRCGNIDPGFLLYLFQEKKYTADEAMNLLYKESGLLGVSEVSNDVRKLEQCDSPYAAEALNLFCYRAARELCALLAPLKGCDAIVFTAGIGENSAFVRKEICDWLEWLGVVLDDEANQKNKTIISHKTSKIIVAVIPANEEYMIAKHTSSLIKTGGYL